MRAALALALAACVHAPPPPAAPPPTAPPAAPAVHDACADEAARLQPMLDANAALFRKWGDVVDVDVDPLVTAAGELEPVTARLPVVAVSPHHIGLLDRAGSAAAIAARVRLLVGRGGVATAGIALAIARDTPWPEVVELVHALQAEGVAHVKLVFAVDRGALAGHIRESEVVVADQELRACPAIAHLFTAPSLEQLEAFAREAAGALQACRCSVSAAQIAHVYAATMVPRYVAARTLTLSPTGAPIAASATATFADAARSIAALAPDAPAKLEVSRP